MLNFQRRFGKFVLELMLNFLFYQVHFALVVRLIFVAKSVEKLAGSFSNNIGTVISKFLEIEYRKIVEQFFGAKNPCSAMPFSFVESLQLNVS